MTTELTKAAQQALEACPFCGADPQDARHIEYGRWAVTCRCGAMGASASTGPNATDAAKIKAYNDARTAWNTRALTQRPAAQEVDEREEFEAWFDDYYDKACAEFGGIDCTDPKGIAEDAWQARASLPAPQQATPATHEDIKVYDGIAAGYFADTQQATPEPGDDAQIRAIGEGLRSAHDHIEMHRLERSHCKDAERIREGLAAFSAYKKRGDFAATPEPVGEPAAWRWFNSNGDQVTNWLDFKAAQKATVEAQVAEAGGRIEYAYTRPAPGVPEVDPLQGAVDWFWQAIPNLKAHDVANRLSIGCNRAARLLAAAQAKGADHA